MVEQVEVHFAKLTPEAQPPQVMQAGDVAADLFAAATVLIPARGHALVPTGIAIELPPGFRARIHARSGLSLKHGIETGAGLIDQAYRHEIGVLLYNHSDIEFYVNPGDRIAQICIERYESPVFIEVAQVEQTRRSTGWGSSGLV